MRSRLSTLSASCHRADGDIAPTTVIRLGCQGIAKRVPEYNLPMSFPRDGSSRSVESMDIRLIVDRIPAFTWSAHADGSVEFVNQRWREYAGLSDEESRGWGWQAAIHPEDLPSLTEKQRQLLTSG